MDQYIKFVIDHWVLCTSVVIVSILIILEGTINRRGEVKRIFSNELAAMLSHEEAIVIDIREPSIFSKEHIMSSINIPFKNGVSEASKNLKSSKDNLVVVVDSFGGAPSQSFAKSLTSETELNVRVLHGGISAWKNSDLPIENQK